MARIEDRLPENAEGEFYVDASCIDCATCRIVAPAVFGSLDRDLAYVHRQPETDEETARALMALVACPTASIGTVHRADAAKAAAAFPERLEEDVYYCGFAARSSFGASSYLVVRPDGNVLVDSPRAASPLLRRITELGGVRLMFLTHRDDVADHALFRRCFGCERVLHTDDVTAGTADVERRIEGREPMRLADDLVVLPVPGHTRGSAVLLYRDRFLFTGDHLMGTEDGRALHASRGVCWYSWPEQVRSMEQLLDFAFEWVLPGHGGRYRAESPAAMRRE
ncbi:MAG TPA: MBL fold metallo-hydrolase, partial [Vicinamibacteria bacterium]|nr:MBL fold metallo-hydrolase [Vicinamibacteria bacterium]